MKKFFSITNIKYCFEITDITTIFTILNVILIITHYWIAPLFGITNCIIGIIINIKNHNHINSYITNIFLIILNLYLLVI